MTTVAGQPIIAHPVADPGFGGNGGGRELS